MWHHGYQHYSIFSFFFRHYHYVVIFITVIYILGSIYRHEVILVWLVSIHIGFFMYKSD